MSNPQSLPGLPWFLNADIHTLLTYIKVAATDIADPATRSFILVDDEGRIQISSAASSYDSYMANENTNFTAAGSPVAVDCNATLGRNAQEGYIVCDGPGDITISLSNNDVPTWGNSVTLKEDNVLHLTSLNVNQFRITHSGTDSAYRYFAI